MVARRGAGGARFLPLVLLWLMASGAFPTSLWGQGQSAPRLKVTEDMAFGEVLAGAAFRLDPLVEGAGAFEVDGSGGAEILLAFILPLELVGPGGSTVPISFGDADAILTPERKDPESGGRFDPRVPITFISPNNNGKAFVWLGATVSPGFSVRAGEYEGTIVIEASYTGN
jgi:hypothetical protein